MRFLEVHLLALSLLFLSSGCLKDGEVLVDDLSNIKAQVFKVENQNGKLVIEGKNLNATRKIQIKGDSIDNEMVIESQSESKIVAALSQALTLTASAVYELVLSNAYGQSVYQLSFEIQDGQVTTVKLADGAVTGDKIADMGALSGQILKYNGTTWSPADLNSLVYAGTWDASTGTEPDSSPVGGDFWIVDTDGDVDLGDGNGVRQWRVGDWIVYNSFTSQWDQVISSQSVVSFNGRAGEVTAQANDYTWQQIDKTLAPIDDLTDVDTSTVTPGVGEVLKWDGSNWTPQVDENDGGDITEVNAGTGLLGGATSGSATLDIDVGTGASQIPQLDASGLLLNSIIPGLDTSKITTGTMNTARLPYASSTTDGIISSSDYQTFSDTDTTLSNGAAGEYLDGDGNWYVLDNAAVGLGNVTNDQQIPLANLDTSTALGTDDTLVPSQNAVKTYVDNSVSTASNDYLLRDGTQAMTGNFDGGANDLININNTQVSNELRLMDDDDSNYVALKSPTTVSTNLTWLLPATDGSAGQILSTDGAGNLSWSSSGDGSVTDVTATAPLSSSGTNTPDISISQSNSTTDGYLSSTDWNTFNAKEDALGTGVANQYLDENKSWQNLDTDAVIEAGNKYFTDSRAQTAVVTQTITNGVTTTSPSEDAVFDALALKADQASLSDYVLKGGDTMTGALNLPADGLDVGSGQLTASGGNIGVGLTNPGSSFVVRGDAAGPVGLSSDVATISSSTSDNTSSALALRNSSGSTIARFYGDTSTFLSPNVGVGTTTASEALDVNGNVIANSFISRNPAKEEFDRNIFSTDAYDFSAGSTAEGLVITFDFDNTGGTPFEFGLDGSNYYRVSLESDNEMTVRKYVGGAQTILANTSHTFGTRKYGFKGHIQIKSNVIYWTVIKNNGSRKTVSGAVDTTNLPLGNFFVRTGTSLRNLKIIDGGRESVSGDNTLVADHVNKSVGIGTSNPSEKLDVMGNLNLNDYDIKNEGNVYWGVISLSDGGYRLHDGTVGTVTVPTSGNTNCNGSVCLYNVGSDKWMAGFEIGEGTNEFLFDPEDTADNPAGGGELFACHGISAGDNEADETYFGWGEGVRGVTTDTNGHCLGTQSNCATASILSGANSHDVFGVVCRRYY